MSLPIFSRKHVLNRTNSIRVKDPKRLSNKVGNGEDSPKSEKEVPNAHRRSSSLTEEPIENQQLNEYFAKHADDSVQPCSLGTFTFEPDSVDNIQFNAADDKGNITVKAASLNKLVEKIVKTRDELYDIFFATYTSFTDSDQLVSTLLSLYQPNEKVSGVQVQLIPEQEYSRVELTSKEHDFSESNKRVIDSLIYWLNNYHYEIPAKTICRLILFLKGHPNKELEAALLQATVNDEVTFPLAMEWEEFLETIPKSEHNKEEGGEEEEEQEEEEEEGEDEEEEGSDVEVLEEDDGKPILPKDWDGKTFDFLQWSPKEIARQLSLLEQDYFVRVQPRECINDNFNQKRIHKHAPNISRLIDHFNNTSRWVVVTILREPDADRRVNLLKHFIDLTSELIEMHNFQTVMALGAAFNASALYRLEQLWSSLDENYISSLEYVRELLDPGKKFKNLREACQEPDSTPCIPYIGILLSDLSAVETVYDEKIGDLINVNKKRLSTKVMRAIQTYQCYRFSFEPIEFIAEELDRKSVV